MDVMTKSYVLKQGGIYIPNCGMKWYLWIRKSCHWTPLERFGLDAVDHGRSLLINPFAYTFHISKRHQYMCVLMMVEDKPLGVCCAIKDDDYINRAYYYANGTYVGVLPYRYKYFKLARLFDQMFYHIYKNGCRDD